MLSRSDNELLCRVGPGTPMGDLMRQYWLPVLYDWELEADGVPLRVRILGEDLIAWRDSRGQPGFVAENCRTAARRCFSAATKKRGSDASITAGNSTFSATA